MSRSLLPISFFSLLMVAAPAKAQLVDEFNPPKSNCCLAGMVKSLTDQLQDWNQLGAITPRMKV